ncbi:hypothetical protein Tco_1196939 [Tanacetum coccineum]
MPRAIVGDTQLTRDYIPKINEPIVPRFILDPYSQFKLQTNDSGHLLISFTIQHEFITLSLEQFGRILRIPYTGQCAFTNEWDLSSLSIFQKPKGTYHTELPTPDDIHRFLRLERVESNLLIKGKNVDLSPNQVLTKEVNRDMKRWEELIRKNVEKEAIAIAQFLHEHGTPWMLLYVALVSKIFDWNKEERYWTFGDVDYGGKSEACAKWKQTMTTTSAQQVALDNALVPLEKRVEISKCNMRIYPVKTLKEPTYQFVFDALALTTCYPAFLITADVREIYMHQFWFTINKKDSISYRLLNQDFDELPSNKEIVSFIKELGHKGDIKSITEVVVDHKYQPWRTFTAIINKCLSGKITGLDKLRLSNSSIPWGMIYKKKMFMHTARDDSILGTIRFVSKSEDFQVYVALLPSRMTNRQMRESDAYKTYLAYATGAASPKMKRKLKQPASPLKKRTLVTVEEEEPEPAKKVIPTKKPATKRQSFGVQIRDTPGMSVSKKKAPAKVTRSKGIELLYDATLLEEAQLKKTLKRSKRETTIHQTGGSSEGADSESEVLDEPKGNGDEDADDQQGDDERTESDDEPTETDNPKTSDDEEEIQDDEFVHTPEDYVPTDDELNDVTEEEYERINEELYGDVNVSLTDAEPADKEKDDVEMIVAGHVNVNHEVACNQVKDDAQATQKTDASIPSSSISSDYAAKFLNFDNIPPTNTKVVSMMVINVQHAVPRTSSLLTIPMSVIPKEDVIK